MTIGQHFPVPAAMRKTDVDLHGGDISDADIARAAQFWREFYGGDALAEARNVVLALREKGDLRAADRWLRLIIAIEQQTRPARPEVLPPLDHHGAAL
jgi:hypothetical protein